MKDQIEKLYKQAKAKIPQIPSVEELVSYKKEIFGPNSLFTSAMKELKTLAKEQKQEMGRFINETKAELEGLFEDTMQTLSDMQDAKKEGLDVTLPGSKSKRGGLHPITKFERKVEEIFTSMGFMILDGPQLESDFFNFEALNIPSHHPSRDSQDTFYVKGDDQLVMRTHTSGMQVRAMLEHGAPLRAIVPGRVFRNEATDATHDHTFYQVEGFMVDEDISISDLIGVMKTFFSTMFQKELDVRLRPGYFPFVEPGFEMDISCPFCDKKGCSVCKHTTWVELLGCGMIHPTVLEYGGIDPKKYSGFAFGMGTSRLVMIQYGIDDLRHFHGANLSFLKQF